MDKGIFNKNKDSYVVLWHIKGQFFSQSTSSLDLLMHAQFKHLSNVTVIEEEMEILDVKSTVQENLNNDNQRLYHWLKDTTLHAFVENK